MKVVRSIALLLMLVPLPALAVFKCVDPGSGNVTYQDEPCKGGVEVDTRPAIESSDDPARTRAETRRKRAGTDANGLRIDRARARQRAAETALHLEQCERSRRSIRNAVGSVPTRSQPLAADIDAERQSMRDRGCENIP